MTIQSPMSFLLNSSFGLLAFVLAGVVVYKIPSLRLFHRETGIGSLAYAPSFRSADGTQLVMIYLGSAHCGLANYKDLPLYVEEVKTGLRRLAEARRWSFESIGIALDWDPQEGLAHLSKFGAFDELASGRFFENSLAMRYLGAINQPPSTPQILVYFRTVSKPDYARRVMTSRASGEELVVRKIGPVQVRQWIENGLPLPGIESILASELAKDTGTVN